MPHAHSSSLDGRRNSNSNSGGLRPARAAVKARHCIGSATPPARASWSMRDVGAKRRKEKQSKAMLLSVCAAAAPCQCMPMPAPARPEETYRTGGRWLWLTWTKPTHLAVGVACVDFLARSHVVRINTTNMHLPPCPRKFNATTPFLIPLQYSPFFWLLSIRDLPKHRCSCKFFFFQNRYGNIFVCIYQILFNYKLKNLSYK